MAVKAEKVVCHDCLGPMTYKTGVKIERNNFGIPHFVWVCKKCFNEAINRK